MMSSRCRSHHRVDLSWIYIADVVTISGCSSIRHHSYRALQNGNNTFIIVTCIRVILHEDENTDLCGEEVTFGVVNE